MQTDVNVDYTALAVAALAKAQSEAADQNSEAQAFVESLDQSTGGYVQPGATDVSDSMGGVT